MKHIITLESVLIEDADKHLEKIVMLEAEDYDVFCEASAYSPFEYQWRMKRIRACIDEQLEELHELNETMVDNYGESLPDRFTIELLDNNTSSPTYSKCRVCGREIIDGHHEIDHSPLLNAMLK